MLTQLKNGNWRDIAKIDFVRSAGRTEELNFCGLGIDFIRKSRVHVSFLDRAQSEDIEFETDAEAQQYRDELAALVNEARRGPGEVKP